jgi:hypothetical protein
VVYFQFCADYYSCHPTSTIYAVTAFLNILTCSYFCLITHQEARRLNKSFWKGFYFSAFKGSKFLVHGLFAPIYWLPVLLFRFLPLSIKSRVRFARRYGLKAGQGVEEKSETQMKVLVKKTGMGGKRHIGMYESKGNGQPTSLADFLAIYDMLIAVVENLHYVDLVNLGRVSRSVREVVLPSDAYAQRMIHFKMYTCHGESKWECWSCLNLICQVSRCPSNVHIANQLWQSCKYSRALKQTTPCFHLDTCRPYCTNCYFTVVQKHVYMYRHTDQRCCKCAPVTPTPNIFQRCFRSSSYYTLAQVSLPYITRQVCRDCHWLGDGRLLDKRLNRTKSELKNAQGPGSQRTGMDRCGNCAGGLGNGPQWWVCKLCKKECRSIMHGAWSSRTERSKRGEIVEEGAV